MEIKYCLLNTVLHILLLWYGRAVQISIPKDNIVNTGLYYRDVMLNRPRNTCIIINDALYQDLCMFVFFIIMTHHMHLRLCSNFRKQRRLITVLPDLPYYPGLAPKDFLLFLKLDEFLSGHLVVVTSPDKHHSFTQRTLMYFRNGFRD